MNTIVAKSIKHELADIALEVSWAKISQRYFGKSASWMYNKINGIDGNGGVGGFSETEKEQLKNALSDFAARIQRTAERI